MCCLRGVWSRGGERQTFLQTGDTPLQVLSAHRRRATILVECGIIRGIFCEDVVAKFKRGRVFLVVRLRHDHEHRRASGITFADFLELLVGLARTAEWPRSFGVKPPQAFAGIEDRKSTRLNSSHLV